MTEPSMLPEFEHKRVRTSTSFSLLSDEHTNANVLAVATGRWDCSKNRGNYPD